MSWKKSLGRLVEKSGSLVEKSGSLVEKYVSP